MITGRRQRQRAGDPLVVAVDSGVGGAVIKPKLHSFDFLWICRTAYCTTNPQEMERVGFRFQATEARDGGVKTLAMGKFTDRLIRTLTSLRTC